MPDSDPPRSQPVGSQKLKGSTIVVADDDRITRELLAETLRAHGFTVEAVPDGQAAVERVARGGVDLVLLDVLMPRLSGLEACRLLKGMTQDTFLPVLLVTVKTDTASRVEGLKIGADDYVSKPFDERELTARVEAMLRIKRLHDHVVEARAKLEQLSVHDTLTSLYNYRYLHTRLTEEFKRAERYHDPLACMVIDIDRLQSHNEAQGRALGDAILRFVADAIRRSVREVDVVARFGGDEFLVVLPSTHFAGSVTVAERIFRDVVDRPFSMDAGRSARVSLSMGVALYPSRDVRTKDALLRAADSALSTAKREGGGRICVFQQQNQMYTPVTSDSRTGSNRPSRTRSDRPAPATASSGSDDSGAASRSRLRSAAASRYAMTLSASRSGELTAVKVDMGPPKVLVVDDEPTLRRSLSRLLQSRGCSVITADDGEQAIGLLEREHIDVALVDLMMPKVGGLELLEHVRDKHDGVEVVMMTAFGDVETAVKAVRAGAYHFLTKPFRSNDEVVLTVTKAAERRRLVDRAAALEERLLQIEKFGELIGNSPSMQEVYRLAVGVAPTSSTVLILGESGTGKELTARAIHQHSPRMAQPFVAVNCSAIPVELVESELFGHVRGAFTGATATRAGLFETADHGTLFLDEVGDLPPLAQVKLLRALQEGEVKRVGSNDTKTVDVRVVAATNVDLTSRITAGKFREDLYYRLNVVPISLPPLRERRDDIPLLAHHFLKKYAARSNSPVSKISAEAMRLLQAQPWKGNVRELENAIEHAIVFSKDDMLQPADLPFARGRNGVYHEGANSPVLMLEGLDLPYRDAKEQALTAFEHAYFSALLQQTGGNVSEAARKAGLDRSNFRRAVKRAGLKTRDDD